MSFSRLRYHITFATNRRQHWITPEVERVIHREIVRELEAMGGCIVTQNGWFEHQHVVAGIPPTVCVSTAVARMKRASSAAVRRELKLREFTWQEGFYATTVSPRRMRALCRYVDRQKEHHGSGELVVGLEPGDDFGSGD